MPDAQHDSTHFTQGSSRGREVLGMRGLGQKLPRNKGQASFETFPILPGDMAILLLPHLAQPVMPYAAKRYRYTSAFSRPNLWSSSWQGLQAAQSQNIAPASLRFLEWATIAFAPSSPNTCFPTSEPANAIRSSMVVWCSLMASRKVSVALSASSPFATALFQARANDFVSSEADGAASISSTLDAVYASLLVHLHVLSRVPNRFSRYGTYELASY
jgi:hypothetical protein